MEQIWIIVLFTLRELRERKLFIVYGIISTLAIVVTWVLLANGVFNFNQFGAGNSSLEFNLVDMVMGFQLSAILFLSDLFILIAIFSCANLIPIMMEKGAIDIFLSKPISRLQLLLGKYLGGVAFVFLNMLYLVLGLFLVVSIYFDVWRFEILLAVPVITFVFAALNIFLIFFGVVTRGSAIGMIAAYFYFIMLSPILSARESIGKMVNSEMLESILSVIYYALPQVHDIVRVVFKQLIMGGGQDEHNILLYTLLSVIAGFVLTNSIFAKKDL